MPFKTNPKRREMYLRLSAWYGAQPNGVRCSYLEIQQQTGVEMDQNGKDLLRLAARRLHRPYIAISGMGIEILGGANALEITGKRFRHIGSAIERAREIVGEVHAVVEEMTPDARAKLTHESAVLATLHLSAELTKKLPPKG